MAAKYDPLEHYLAQRRATERQVTLTFGEINSLLDSPLPRSAYSLRQWWENPRDASTRPQARAWLNAGFEVDAVKQERRSGMVRFRRR
jgi:hypothetical protein